MSWDWHRGLKKTGLILLLSVFVLGGCTTLYFRSMQRTPEIPVNQFLQKQSEALPPGWSFFEVKARDIWTDTDATWARWAIVTGFTYKDGLDDIVEEIHVFWNPFAARTSLGPSPSSVFAGEGYLPEGWTYRPPHAEEFKFGCRGGDGAAHPDYCSLIMRYEEYVIILQIPIAEYMTLEDLKRLLEVIDREMTDFLQHSTLLPGPRKVPTSLDE